MGCDTCLSVSDIKMDASTKVSDLISCTRCKKPLYCSEVCAELGWPGHRLSCRALPDQGCDEQLLRCQRWRQQRRWEWFRKFLWSFLQRGEPQPSLKDILCLLEVVSSLDTPLTPAVDDTTILQVEEVVGVVNTALGGAVGTLEITTLVLLQVRLLSIFLCEHKKALSLVRQAIRWLTSCKALDDVLACRTLLEAERMSILAREYPKVVMTPEMVPLSSQWIASGEVVARDTVPLLVWPASNFPPALSFRQSTVYDDGLRALRNAYMHAQDTYTASGTSVNAEKSVMRAEMPPLFFLLQGDEELPSVQYANAEVVTSAAAHLDALGEIPSPSWLMKLFFTAMSSRRRCGKGMLGLFEFVSRLRHSCAPNCVWNYETGEVRALRAIAPHEPLTMDVLWEHLTETACYITPKLPTCFRQESILANMGHLCACGRCTGRPQHNCHLPNSKVEGRQKVQEPDMNEFDSMRGFPCPLCRGEGGWRYRRHSREGCQQQEQQKGVSTRELIEMEVRRRLEPNEPWVCLRCGEQWKESEIPLEKEKRLCRQAERLVVLAARGICGRGFFEELKVLMQDVLEVVGHQRHSAYLLACESFVHFYRYVSNRFPPPTGLIAQTYTLSWCRKWITCAQNMQLPSDCPHVYSMFITDTALSLSTMSLLHDKVVLLRHAEAHCPIVVANAAEGQKVAAVTDILYNESSSTFTRMGQRPSAFEDLINADNHLVENALISNWESHLLSRIQLEVSSNETPRLPESLASAFRRYSPT